MDRSVAHFKVQLTCIGCLSISLKVGHQGIAVLPWWPHNNNSNGSFCAWCHSVYACECGCVRVCISCAGACGIDRSWMFSWSFKILEWEWTISRQVGSLAPIGPRTFAVPIDISCEAFTSLTFRMLWAAVVPQTYDTPFSVYSVGRFCSYWVIHYT